MKQSVVAVLLGLALSACELPSKGDNGVLDGGIGFDGGETLDAVWKVASTGGDVDAAHATWSARQDDLAKSKPNVVSILADNHGSRSRFNLLWNPNLRFKDGKLSVHVRADGGDVDQGGGPMWRVKDADNYYVCRVNPLEANYRVYVVQNGKRTQLASATVDMLESTWYRIDVQHVGSHIVCSLDGKVMLEVDDAAIPDAGGVGLWTKADARTSFDDLRVDATQ